MHCALFLDCDGVIILSEEFNFWCWHKALEHCVGSSPLLQYNFHSILGIHLDRIFGFFEEIMERNFSPQERKQLLFVKNSYYCQYALGKLKKTRGIEQLILEAKSLNWVVAVVSSSLSDKLECSLVATGLRPLFEHVFSGQKEIIKNYQKPLQVLKLAHSEVIVVEDTPAGILAAQKAGIATIIGLTTYYSKDILLEYAPSLVVDNLMEIDLKKYKD